MTLSSDWMALRKAGASYQSVLASAWSEAYELYSEEFSQYVDSYANKDSLEGISQAEQYQGLRDSINGWLKIANKQLLATQRSPEFLEAQKELVAAATNFKHKTRELVEDWSETFDIPTRSEVNDLHRTVHELKKELRVLKNQVATLQQSASQNAKPNDEVLAKVVPVKTPTKTSAKPVAKPVSKKATRKKTAKKISKKTSKKVGKKVSAKGKTSQPRQPGK
jgi:hypothetical protein